MQLIAQITIHSQSEPLQNITALGCGNRMMTLNPVDSIVLSEVEQLGKCLVEVAAVEWAPASYNIQGFRYCNIKGATFKWCVHFGLRHRTHTHAEEVASEICPQWHGKSVPSITTLKIFIFANTHCPYFNALGMAGNTVLFVVLVDIW